MLGNPGNVAIQREAVCMSCKYQRAVCFVVCRLSLNIQIRPSKSALTEHHNIAIELQEVLIHRQFQLNGKPLKI